MDNPYTTLFGKVPTQIIPRAQQTALVSDATDASLVSEGWKIADEFYRSIGCDSTAMPIEDRTWDDVYADAMNEHFCEKGILGNRGQVFRSISFSPSQ